MPPLKGVRHVLGLVVIWLLCLGTDTFGQAVAFDPIIGIAPSGQTLTVTPAVSADRRYVRLSVNGFFNTVNGFSSFTTPLGAVGGGGKSAAENGKQQQSCRTKQGRGMAVAQHGLSDGRPVPQWSQKRPRGAIAISVGLVSCLPL